MLTRTPARVATLAAGTAVVASGLMAGHGVAFADDDDDYEHHGTCSSAPVSTRDDHDDDGDYDEDDDCYPGPMPTPTPTPSVTTDPAANAVLSVQRAANRRLDVNAGVENSKPGEAWRLEVWHNGRQRLTTTATADGNGHVGITRALKNRRGTDKIRVVATDSVGQQVSAKVKGFRSAPRPPQNYNPNAGQNGNQNGSNQRPQGTSKQS